MPGTGSVKGRPQGRHENRRLRMWSLISLSRIGSSRTTTQRRSYTAVDGVAHRGHTSIVEDLRTSRWVVACFPLYQLAVSSSSGNNSRRTKLLSGIARVLRFGLDLDTQTVAGTFPGYAFSASLFTHHQVT